jgi:hypothetical protein
MSLLTYVLRCRLSRHCVAFDDQVVNTLRWCKVVALCIDVTNCSGRDVDGIDALERIVSMVNTQLIIYMHTSLHTIWLDTASIVVNSRHLKTVTDLLAAMRRRCSGAIMRRFGVSAILCLPPI